MIRKIKTKEGVVITYFNGFTAMEELLATNIISLKDKNNVLEKDKIINVLYDRFQLMQSLIMKPKFVKDVTSMLDRFVKEGYATIENNNIVLSDNFR